MGFEEEKLLTPLLMRGEKLLWSGRPKQGIMFRRSDVFLIPFSLIWCGGALGSLVGALLNKGPALGYLMGVPFVLVGLYIVFGRFIVDSRIRARTFYGLTNNRILIVSSGSSKRTKSLNLRTLSDISYTERSYGAGTIYFGANDPLNEWSAGLHWPGMSGRLPPCFEEIGHVRSVYEMIDKAQQEAYKAG
jgi:hypothetical protein